MTTQQLQTPAQGSGQDHESLQDKVTLVTGGASGLGACICEVLAQAGARVLCADVDAERASRVADRVSGYGGEIDVVELDLQSAPSIVEAIEHAAESRGSLDVLVNNAGTDVTLPVDELRVEDWDRVMNVNLRAPFVAVRTALPIMKRQGSGAIVNIASTAAKRVWPNASVYHASKTGLLAFTHALSLEAREHGIRVTAVVAGGMQTPFILERFPDTDRNLLQDPRNVAEAVRFALTQPFNTVIPELIVTPLRETSFP